MTLAIRPAVRADAPALWDLLRPVFRAGETYTIDPGISEVDAVEYWTGRGRSAFIAEDTAVVGTYYLVANQGGGGAHVCNAGFVVHPDATGRGVARAMLAHALDTAVATGYRAMQFNFVVATNTGAIRLWERAGFATVGRLPGAFRHPAHGYVDALVMFKSLTEGT